jgi:MFS family permease
MGAFEAGVLLLPQALIMAVCMPLAGRLYDKIGPRWPAVIGLAIVSLGTWLLRDLSVDTPHWEISMLLMLRAAGMGLAMMPVMTSGIAAVPPASVNAASAFNNVVQRTAASLGLAILTAVLTGTQAQLTADRSGLMTDPTVLPTFGPGAQGHVAGMMVSYQRMGTQVFVEALDNLMVITTVISLVAVALAFLLRSGPLARSAPPAAPAEPPAAGPAEVDEPTDEGARTPISARS